jgi:CTP:molybdopterin cytidylyltransferase MocA
MTVPAVVLAAGRSSRMGRTKALLPIGSSGQTFLTRIVDVLRMGGAAPVVVVVGTDADAVIATLPGDDPTVRVVRNPRVDDGQLSSLLLGLDVVEWECPEAPGTLMTLVDLPLIAPDTVRRVIAAVRESPSSPLVRPTRGPRFGHPVYFGRALFAEFRAADPAFGAKPVVRAHAHEERTVPIDDDGSFADVDTPDDYERLIRPTLSAGPTA